MSEINYLDKEDGEDAFNSLIDDQKEFMNEFRTQLNQLDTVRAGLNDMIEEGEENALMMVDIEELKEVIYNLETEITEVQESAGWI